MRNTSMGNVKGKLCSTKDILRGWGRSSVMGQMHSMSKDQSQTPKPKQDNTPTPFPLNTATLEILHKNNQDKIKSWTDIYRGGTEDDSVWHTGRQPWDHRLGNTKVLSELAWPCQHLDLILLASTIPYFSFFVIVGPRKPTELGTLREIRLNLCPYQVNDELMREEYTHCMNSREA